MPSLCKIISAKARWVVVSHLKPTSLKGVWPACPNSVRHREALELRPGTAIWGIKNKKNEEEEKRKTHGPVPEIINECHSLIRGFKLGWALVELVHRRRVSVRKSSTQQQERGDSKKLLCQSCWSLLMQSASAESTAGLSASFTALHAWGQSAKRNTAESVETVSLSRFFFFPSNFADNRSRSVVWDRISDRKLSASACYLSARRHQGTGEGRQRVVNTDESNYWHLQPTSLLRAWTTLKGHRCEGSRSLSVHQFKPVSHPPNRRCLFTSWAPYLFFFFWLYPGGGKLTACHRFITKAHIKTNRSALKTHPSVACVCDML